MKMKRVPVVLAVWIAFVAMATAPGFSEEMSDEELAKKTQNPVANLTSLPLQLNADYGNGPADAAKYTLNIQPVIPFSLNEDWNLITRTIVPLIHAESPIPNGDDGNGWGDIMQSFFFTPKKDFNSWIVGGGPVLRYPSATDDTLGSEKWSAGPTMVVLKQESGFTYGILVNHLWSYAGDCDRSYINATFLQPVISYTTKMHTSFGLNTESTYDWREYEWIVPINVLVTQMLKIGNQLISLQIAYRYYAEKPEGGSDWGLRFALTFLFPK
ncbi:MAG: transporter [Deltaproteobacteria bacterium]|nr:transporter [Deltaproteobacteria bacterium]